MSRLYPGFGSGKGTYTGDFVVQSLAAAGHAEMEVGDKIILPQSVLKEVTRLKLPFPLTFRVTSDKCVCFLADVGRVRFYLIVGVEWCFTRACR
jgi:hypothetical protein